LATPRGSPGVQALGRGRRDPAEGQCKTVQVVDPRWRLDHRGGRRRVLRALRRFLRLALVALVLPQQQRHDQHQREDQAQQNDAGDRHLCALRVAGKRMTWHAPIIASAFAGRQARSGA
jgi:hypothetical protein